MGNCINSDEKDIAINGKDPFTTDPRLCANYRSKEDKSDSHANSRTPLSALPANVQNAKHNNSSANDSNRTPSSSHSKVVIALYTYNAKDDGDLSFRKGERLQILDDSDPDWWLAKHMISNQKGYIPMNYVASEAIEMEESVTYYSLVYWYSLVLSIPMKDGFSVKYRDARPRSCYYWATTREALSLLEIANKLPVSNRSSLDQILLI